MDSTHSFRLNHPQQLGLHLAWLGCAQPSTSSVAAPHNSATYQPLGFNNAWRRFVYATHSGANARQSKFLREWVGELVATHLGTTSNNAGGGQQSGGVQTNLAHHQARPGAASGVRQFFTDALGQSFSGEVGVRGGAQG